MYTALSKNNNIVPVHGGLSLFGPQQLYGQVYLNLFIRIRHFINGDQLHDFS